MKKLLISVAVPLCIALFGLIQTFVTAGKATYAVWILVVFSLVTLMFGTIFLIKMKKSNKISVNNLSLSVEMNKYKN